MGGVFVFNYGVGAALDFASNDSNNIEPWYVVRVGGRIVLFDWCNILFVAQNEIFARVMASVRYWWVGMLLFCRVIWQYYRFPVAGVFRLKKRAYCPFFMIL